MRCLVTGVGGFIGSHLAERLIRDGHEVVGVDCFLPYYARTVKESNLRWLREQSRFLLREEDLRVTPMRALLDGIDTIFHEAAMAGLMASWDEFDLYMTCNIQASQRLLDAARTCQLRRFIHVSTSSVYGRNAVGDERGELKPISPYGVTKLAAERLAIAFHEVFALPVVVLRYFSVYGPRQRPDMGYNIFIDRILSGQPIVIYGDGEQTRGNTFVSDCVDATLLASEHGQPGEIYNVGGGEARSVNWVISTLEELCGRTAQVSYAPPRPGDQANTLAHIDKARTALHFEPKVGLRAGLAAQVDWQRTRTI